MVNGPPTPPPTTAAELQDEARIASTSTADQAPAVHASDPPPPQAAPETRLEIYQDVLPALIDSLARNEYNRLVLVAEEADLEARQRAIDSNQGFLSSPL
ncbi:hypothetical protein NLJ89_g1574 [Agrocybe chaxingu]|uniref:Uncharacterized protein n=1 Tax=Agrocybe chaxingu TaxID=84603 RepID=A0A9W8MZS1_9AGAR|nr:hypothetical protein NLJ89_g1574 [Agrocybe chaxingu]